MTDLDWIGLATACKVLGNMDTLSKKYRENGWSEENLKMFFDAYKRLINDIFKKHMGISPGEYRQKYRESLLNTE